MTNDLTPEMELVMKHFIKLSDVPVDQEQLEKQLKINSSTLSIVLSKIISKGYIRTFNKTEEGSTGMLMFALTTSGKEKAQSLT